MIAFFLLALLIALNAADAYLTILVIRRGGREANSFMKDIARFLEEHHFGGRWLWLAIPKGVLIVLCTALVVLDRGVTPIYVLSIIDVLYALIAFHNWTVLRSLA
jgi:hypothetical protein